MPYRRREERLVLRVPIDVTIKARGDGDVDEVYQGAVLDTSRSGMKIQVPRSFPRQALLLLTLPFSYAFREYRFSGRIYQTHARVAYSIAHGAGVFEIGVELLHDYLPPGHEALATGNT